MKLQLRVEGQCPSGKNSVIVTRSGKRFPSQRFSAWREQGLKQVHKQLKGCSNLPITTPVNVEVSYAAGDMRRRDVPGIVDAVWHLLEKAGVVSDDCLLAGHEKELLFKHLGKQKTPYVDVCINTGNK